MKRRRTPEQVLADLPVAPAQIGEIARRVSTEELHSPPAAGEWSANDVLAHLRSCADVWGDCIRAIAAGAPTIRAVNPRRWIKQTTHPDEQFATSLAAFTSQRHDLLAFLEALSPEEWERSALVTGAGKPLQRSVLFYATWLVDHERPHVKQIARTVDAVRHS